MDLIEYRNSIFDKNKFTTIPDAIKKKHWFMLVRFFSIKYPVEASQVQVLPYSIGTGIIHSILSRGYTGRLPGWVFTRGNSTKEDTKSPIATITTEVKNWYWDRLELDTKDAEYASKYPTPTMVKKLKVIQSSELIS